MKEPCWLEVSEVKAIHGEIIAESGGAAGVLNEGDLDAALNKSRQLYHYGEAVTLYDLAAAYGYGLIKNHCFVDGNKRIALIAVYVFLSVNGVELTASEVDAVTMFLGLAASGEPQEVCVEQLAGWLRGSSAVRAEDE